MKLSVSHPSHSPWKSTKNVDAYGCPVAFYSDKHSVFRGNKPDAKGGSGMTQFGRALAELNHQTHLRPL